MKRLNTQLESEAAEFFVLANLLLNKIPSHKNYTRHKDYDIIATNPATNRLARIQVKSRFRLNAPGFLISNFNSDFVVFCKLNRSLKESTPHGIPEYYIFPTRLVEKSMVRNSSWEKCYLKDIPDCSKYHNNWKLIETFLSK
jgi:hypothetical protein